MKNVNRGLAIVGLMGAAASAQAVAVLDFGASVTSATTELTGAISSGLPFFGTLVGIAVGIRVFQKMTGKRA